MSNKFQEQFSPETVLYHKIEEIALTHNVQSRDMWNDLTLSTSIKQAPQAMINALRNQAKWDIELAEQIETIIRNTI